MSGSCSRKLGSDRGRKMMGTAQVDEVVALVGDMHSREDIMLDLELTKSVEATVNRIFDGVFLAGTSKDPSLKIVRLEHQRSLLLDGLDEPELGTNDAFRNYDFKDNEHEFGLKDDDDDLGSLSILKDKKSRLSSPKKGKRAIAALDSDDDLLEGFEQNQKESISRFESFVDKKEHKSFGLNKALSDSEDSVIDLTEVKPARSSSSQSKSTFSASFPTSSNFSSSSAKVKPTSETVTIDSDDDMPTQTSTTLVTSKKPSFMLNGSSSQPSLIHSQNPATLPKSSSAFPWENDEELYMSSSSNSSKSNVKNFEIPTVPVPTTFKKYPWDSALQSSEDEEAPTKKKAGKRKADGPAAKSKADKEAKKEKWLDSDSSSSSSSEEEKPAKKARARKKTVTDEDKARKEQEKFEKQLEKAQKQQYKAANKIRDKKACCQEMILELDPACVAERCGATLVSAVQEMGTTISIQTQPMPLTMRWKRKVTREWNDEKQLWTPCDERLEYEPFVLIRLDAAELSRLVQSPGGYKSYYSHVCSKYPGYSIILFVEGIKNLLKSRTKAIDSQIRSGVRTMYGQVSKSNAGAAGGQDVATKAVLDECMLWLQMQGNTFIQLSESVDESQRYIVGFTSSIAAIPERKRRNEETFKLNFGDTVKSGSDLQDIWRRILLEIKPCTESVANAILEEYPNYRSLIEAYNRIQSVAGREGLLENIMVQRKSQSRRIGPALSRKIYLGLMSDDPTLAIFDPPPPKQASKWQN
ncbi:putative monocarboxylate transporter mch1, partial [Chytridiales sp. JEL 0842]